ncbi:unnamed protein product [Thelazia callipaeda]|uniref:SH3 domain-containing protein n=1 Tax=Thelazia callipaeda TaxID=103827 RepID=A0A0N5D1M6_THECL|nr:unnamed protein product [Thelazia callipaeda]
MQNKANVPTYMRAIANYVTNEPNLLSFSKGDIIQIISRSNETFPEEQNNEQWLYGKIGNNFGNLPANYVEPLDMFGQVGKSLTNFNSAIINDLSFTVNLMN